jgi:hypothetical protein
MVEFMQGAMSAERCVQDATADGLQLAADGPKPMQFKTRRRQDMMNQKVREVLRNCRNLSRFGAAVVFALITACHHSPKRDGLTYGGTGDDRGNAVQQTTDGGYIIAGTTSSFGAGGKDVYLIRTKAAGETLWTHTYGGTNDDVGNAVQWTSDGGYIVAGSTSSFGAGSGDVYLIKTNAAGDTQWTRTFGGTRDDIGSSVRQTSDGGYVVAGATLSFGAGNYDVYLVKTDAAGGTPWTRTYGGSNDDKGTSVVETRDSGYVIVGFTASFGAGNYDYYLLNINPVGDTQWTRTFGGANSDQSYSVCQTSDGGYVAAGNADSYGAGSSDVYLVRTDAAGDSLWTRTYGGVSLDWSMAVEQNPDSGFIVAGATGSFGAGVLDVYLIKTNAAGDSLWTRTYGGAEADKGFLMQRTADGGYIVVGVTGSYGAGGEDVYLIKTNSQGDAEFVQ